MTARLASGTPGSSTPDGHGADLAHDRRLDLHCDLHHVALLGPFALALYWR